MSIIGRFTPEKGQVVTVEGQSGTFKVLDVSADGQIAAIQPFSLSKQMVLGSALNIASSTLHHFEENATQAAARIMREARELEE